MTYVSMKLRLIFVPAAFVLLGAVVWAGVSMPFTPPADQKGSDSFSFAVYGDIQDNYRKGHNALVGQMLLEPVELVFNTGDISPHDGKHYDRHFYPVIEKLVRRVPFFPAVGNHDVDWNSPRSRMRFYEFFREVYGYLARRPGNEHLLDASNQKLWYSLIYRNVLFLVLDSNFFIDEGHYETTHSQEVYRGYLKEQLGWIQERLEEAGRNPSIRAKFVFFHHSPFFTDGTSPIPVFGFGGHPGHHEMVVEQKMPSDQPGPELYLLDLFRKYRVDTVFTGHEHYYERWKEIIRERGQPFHVINWVVTGLGGVKPRGQPEYEQEEVTEVLEEEEVYQRYLDRVSVLQPDWTAELKHAYPTEDKPTARFHHYVLVTVKAAAIQFQTKDSLGNVRDEGFFRP